jgi:protein-S-isoprenylcysteine O-methyltransferase Ste14
MATLIVIILRAASLAAFAAPMLLSPNRERKDFARQPSGNRAPVFANVAASALFFVSLIAFAGGLEGQSPLILALTGFGIAVAGAALVLRSRVELGAAWSFAPTADEGMGFVTTGPYRVVRHPIYLGFSMMAMGQAVAFSSWPSLLILVCGIVPTFAWRAYAEEKLLSRTFGERYALYRGETKMIVPYLL